MSLFCGRNQTQNLLVTSAADLYTFLTSQHVGLALSWDPEVEQVHKSEVQQFDP